MAYVIIGTAGHIDHGKSALVNHLTGQDPDRLHEEKERGMTIDLGFAFLDDHTAIIDVPGHEKFIKNMVAGVSTVDIALLVVAADDGVMPQTREHLDILSLLDIRQGVLAITKIDLVDPDWLDLVEEDLRETVKGTRFETVPCYRVSSHTGEGIEALRQALLILSHDAASRPAEGFFWMPVDRSFHIKGFGTVVTGSILSGTLTPGTPLEVLPAGLPTRVRGIQTHGHTAQQIGAGERAALNIQNIATDDIQRGDVLATPHRFHPTPYLDVKLTLLPTAPRPLRQQTRVRLHLGTREIMSRVKLLDTDSLAPGESGFGQLLLEERTVARRGDRFIIRQYSPMRTIGGGVILDSEPRAHRRVSKTLIKRLQALEQGDPETLIAVALADHPEREWSASELSKLTGLPQTDLERHLSILESNGTLVSQGNGAKRVYLLTRRQQELHDNLLSTLETYHQRFPLRPACSKAELKDQLKAEGFPQTFENLIETAAQNSEIVITPLGIKHAAHSIELSPEQKKQTSLIREHLENNGFQPPLEGELAKELNIGPQALQDLLGAMRGLGEIVRVQEGMYFTPAQLERATAILRDIASTEKDISVSRFREDLNTTRRYAMGLLTWFDQNGVTIRTGEVRTLYE
jgi:selenocysteine-specific elongation factor